MKVSVTNKYQKNSVLTKALLYLFAVSMALGNWNPLLQGGDSEETATSLSTFIIILLVPYLLFEANKANWWKNKYTTPLFQFFVIIFISSLLNASTISVSFFVYYTKLLVGILLCSLLPVYFVREPRLIYISLLIYSVACAFVGTAIFMGYGEQYMSIHNGRLWLFGENPNTTSGRYGIAVIVLFYLIFNNPLQLKANHYFLLPFIFPLMSLIVMSGSRGSLLITGMSILLYAYLVNKKNSMQGLAIFSVVIIPLAVYTVNQMFDSDYSMLERLTRSANEEGGNEIRDRLFWASYDIFLHNPIIGMGTVDFKRTMLQNYFMDHTAHNMYIYILATSGIVGFTPFAVFLFRLFKKAYSRVKYSFLPLLLLFFICFIAYKTGGILTYLFMWYIFSIIISAVEIKNGQLISVEK